MDPKDKALRALIDTIEATGGLMRDPKGTLVPVADDDWSDLASVYLDACEAMGITPKIEE